MKYDLYFHNDFDGWASAATMLAFLRSRGDAAAHLAPVDFHLQSQWFTEGFFEKHTLFRGKRHPAIVLDFPFHPRAAIWFDHHPTAFRKDGWRKRFTPDRFHVLDPRYLSCTHLIYASLKKNFGWNPPRHFKELARWLDVIDGAKYASPGQTLALKEPALQVDAFIDEVRHGAHEAGTMVERLSREPLSKIARLSTVQKKVAMIRREHAKALAFYRTHMQVLGNATFIDLVNAPVKKLRYASYYLYPQVRYGVRFEMKGPFYHVGIGSNPWMDLKGSAHIGKLLRRYGGGGHKGAGAADFKKKRDAENAAPEIIEFLNHKR